MFQIIIYQIGENRLHGIIPIYTDNGKRSDAINYLQKWKEHLISDRRQAPSRLNSLSPSVPELSILIGAPYLYFVTSGYSFIQYCEPKIKNPEAVVLKIIGRIWLW